MTVRDDRSDVKQTTTGFRGPLMVQSLTSAKSKFLSLNPSPLLKANSYPSAALVSRHRIYDSAGTPIDHVWLSRENDDSLANFDPNVVALLAHKPLTRAMRYQVELIFSHKGQDETLSWYFTCAN